MWPADKRLSAGQAPRLHLRRRTLHQHFPVAAGDLCAALAAQRLVVVRHGEDWQVGRAADCQNQKSIGSETLI